MALNKLDKSSREFTALSHQDEEEWMVVLKDLIEKVNTGFDKTNEHINKMATNDAKVGITTSQANAIVANTAKTGITSQQATDITTNNAKVGITTKQSTQLNLLVQSAIQLTSAVKGTTVNTPVLTLIPGKASGSYSLRLSVRVTPQGGKTLTKYIDLPLT